MRPHLPTTPPKLESGALVAGNKVVAIDTVSPVSAIALVLEGGAAYETSSTAGASKVLELMAFKSTRNRSTFRLTREIEKIGASVSAKAGRDHIVYTISAPRLNTAEATEILLDAVLNARCTYWETAEVLPVAKNALKAASRNPTNLVLDTLHRAAFDGSLSAPLHTDPALLANFTNAKLFEYAKEVLRPSSAVLAAAGVGLDAFTQLANPLVGKPANDAPAAQLKSSYVGGTMNVLASTSPLTYVGLGFESPGGLSQTKSAAVAEVVKGLLDESRSVLPHQYKEGDVFVSAEGFSCQYKDTGLVGVIAASAPGQAGQLVDAVTKKVEGLAKGVDEGQLRRAKQQAVGKFKAQMFSSGHLAAHLASSLLISGRYNPTEFTAAVEAVTADDVSKYVAAALKAERTLVTYGNINASVARRVARK